MKVAIAVNFWLVVGAILALPGRMAREERLAACVLADVVPFTEPKDAAMVTEPRARAAARPFGLIETTPLFEEDQFTRSVMSCVV